MNCPECGLPGLRGHGPEYWCVNHGSFEFLPPQYPDPELDSPHRGGRRASTPIHTWTPKDEDVWQAQVREDLMRQSMEARPGLTT